jgi:hypothetical protein
MPLTVSDDLAKNILGEAQQPDLDWLGDPVTRYRRADPVAASVGATTHQVHEADQRKFLLRPRYIAA